MASQGYYDWLNAGGPYVLIRPAKAVQATLRRHGLTVYDYPDDAHLKASTPEDHTPFSVTGWPGQNRRWKARALDVMPRGDTAAARKENADIARQLIRDRDAGVAGAMWIKYLNWTDEQGVCRQERWMDAGAPLRRTTRSSTDRGHVHISGRSDADSDDRADGYDPIARMRGLTEGDDMQLSDTSPWSTQFTGEDGVTGPWLGGTMGNQLQYIREDAHFARALTERLAAAAAADEVRDKASLAAIQGIATAITAGGGNVDTAPVVAAITAVRDEARQRFAELAAQATFQAQRIAELEAELAATRAAAEANLSPAERAALPPT
jgi:hypothetical protein